MALRESFKDELRRSIEGEVRFDAGTRALYATDASNYRRVPVGVVIPRQEEDVARTLALARENSIPILARGGGTALAGQTTNAALILDFSKYMNAVISIDPQARLARVQPGLVQAHLNRAAAVHGLFFAPDPATKDRCTLGGMIGNNSCGAHSAAYGKTVDNLAGLELLLYDGTRLSLGEGREDRFAEGSREARIQAQARALIARCGDLVRERYPNIPRRVSGYNLDELLPERGFNLARAVVGSEGTLGVILEATVKLTHRPKCLALVVAGFDDVFIAADQMPWMLRHRPQALEGFDEHLADFGRLKGFDTGRLLPQGRAFLLIELGGDSAAAAADAAEAFRAEAKKTKQCAGLRVLLDPAGQAAVWRLRESGLGAGATIPGGMRTWPGAEDCAVPPARLGEYLRRFVKVLGGHRLAAAIYYGHFGEGCIHCRINFDLASAAGVANFRSTMVEIGELVAEFGGSLSGEHGDGLARSELLPKMFGGQLIDAFRDFKTIFDPDFRMNPGVLVQPEPLDSNLRLGPYYSPRQVPSHFDFSADGGIAGAALRCVGIGKCRKTDAGTMCPSYIATREEKHSTRGRAHLLHEALAGDLLGNGFAQPELFEALELCLSCKSCKTECPASVDMAAYKAEFMTSFYREHRRPAAVQFFGRIHEFARIASVLPGLSNRMASGRSGAVARRLLRIHPERSLPHFATRPFRSWFRHRPASVHQGREVLLFPDTFNNFFEPETAIAAVGVLERAGFNVTIPPRDLCCGRPLYDHGMLDMARRRLADILHTLAPFLARGIPVIGLEPSCILTFRDELPMMFPRASDARTLAARTYMLDEFLAREAAEFSPPALRGRALVHGHCHQKSIGSMSGELAILRAAGLAVEVPDSGCCGMAGAFGYGLERYEISRAIGERVLLPAVREAPPDTIIIADGFACRTQIRQFCPSRRPMHLAEVLNLAAGANQHSGVQSSL